MCWEVTVIEFVIVAFPFVCENFRMARKDVFHGNYTVQCLKMKIFLSLLYRPKPGPMLLGAEHIFFQHSVHFGCFVSFRPEIGLPDLFV